MSEHMSRLAVADYVVFGLMLVISAAIGIYFIFAGKGQKTDGEYLMGGRQMGFFPVTLSLLASCLSAISLLGIPAEIYRYGTQWLFCAMVGFIVMTLIMVYVVLPVVHPLKLTSINEYLELRFHPLIRFLVTLTLVLHNLVYIGIALYAPALALNAVTGVSWRLCVVGISIICTIYTSLGGLKAVIWTDAFQIFIMAGGLLAIVIKSAMHFGGLTEVYHIMAAGGRIQLFNFNPSPMIRTTAWSGTTGMVLICLYASGISQPFAQRYFSCSTLKSAKTAAWLNCVGFITMATLCVISGSCAYAFYVGCDPLTTGRIGKPDQQRLIKQLINLKILPLLVTELMANETGFAGLFVSSIFCGCLSTLSSWLNSLAAIVVRDLVHPVKMLLATNKNKDEDDVVPNDKTASKSSKIIAASFGVVGLGMAFVASIMGDILQVGFQLVLMVESAPIAIFLMGILLPFVNWKGALAGLLTGQFAGIWLGIGNFLTRGSSSSQLALSVLNCTSNFTNTNIFNQSIIDDWIDIDLSMSTPTQSVYQMSYYLQGVISFFVTVFVGCLVSLLTGSQNKEQLQSRCIHHRLRVLSGSEAIELNDK